MSRWTVVVIVALALGIAGLRWWEARTPAPDAAGPEAVSRDGAAVEDAAGAPDPDTVDTGATGGDAAPGAAGDGGAGSDATTAAGASEADAPDTAETDAGTTEDGAGGGEGNPGSAVAAEDDAGAQPTAPAPGDAPAAGPEVDDDSADGARARTGTGPGDADAAADMPGDTDGSTRREVLGVRIDPAILTPEGFDLERVIDFIERSDLEARTMFSSAIRSAAENPRLLAEELARLREAAGL